MLIYELNKGYCSNTTNGQPPSYFIFQIPKLLARAFSKLKHFGQENKFYANLDKKHQR